MIEGQDKWVNLPEIADYLSVSTDTIRLWIKQKKIPTYRLGKMYKFKLSEIDEWVRSEQNGGSDEKEN